MTLKEIISELRTKRPTTIIIAVDGWPPDNISVLKELEQFIIHHDFKRISFRDSHLDQFPIRDSNARNALMDVFMLLL